MNSNVFEDLGTISTTKFHNCHILKNRCWDYTICLIALCSMLFPQLSNYISSFSLAKHLLKVFHERSLKLSSSNWKIFCTVIQRSVCIFTFTIFNFNLILRSWFYLSLCFPGYVMVKFNWITTPFQIAEYFSQVNDCIRDRIK